MFTSTDIKSKINQLRHHYNSFINNKYVKGIMMKLDIPHTIHRDMDYILLSEIVYIDSKGSLTDIYTGVKAVIFLIKDIELKVIPNIQGYADAGKNSYNANESILFQMAIKNFAMNVETFTNILEELYTMLIDYDNEHFPKSEVYKSVRDFADIQVYFDSKKRESSRK
ncbi:MAG: hypothetical protein A2015_09120 [Spirochaetes bacterium GWF1_31_7]|nr:MAG: hypothetical protein A2Y30_09100 [Spirochaetes bacterium GWE1_32_154]OHD44857.1 MAG: hypothetical protein A2Y29_09280 [Spirochaetes bacterium GWE2_31_10]OHD47648.1 MAG: hypothetical protein A2015_09120 [Spirochaetes bacterium GWF1_31_7]OHD82848.1 MAG: hypothetical protein A2355_04970 [Spirochaetes bacterium RIFOXYB1_FULL_32_8]HBD94426.1 hypothetical protein [Spirochaetia bacterium]